MVCKKKKNLKGEASFQPWCVCVLGLCLHLRLCLHPCLRLCLCLCMCVCLSEEVSFVLSLRSPLHISRRLRWRLALLRSAVRTKAVRASWRPCAAGA